MSYQAMQHRTRMAAVAAALVGVAMAFPAAHVDSFAVARHRVPGSATPSDAVGGPRTLQETLPSGSADSWTIHFVGERPAEIEVVGDGSGDVDCFVYDAAGALVQFDIAAADRCSLRWRPARTAAFDVVVRNVGQVADRYTLHTN